MPTWGRGGAGNIMTDEQISAANKRASADLEAQQHAADNALNPATQPTESANAAYAYRGRGGAGNLFSPSSLSQTGTFHDSARSNILGEGTAPPPPHSSSAAADASAAAESAQGHRGRGGAGNYVWSGQREEEKAMGEREEVERRDVVRERVAKDVEEGLKRPEGVYLREGKEKGEVSQLEGV